MFTFTKKGAQKKAAQMNKDSMMQHELGKGKSSGWTMGDFTVRRSNRLLRRYEVVYRPRLMGQ